LAFLVINKGISGHGDFVQYLISIDITEECLDFDRKVFDDEETEVKKKFFLKIRIKFRKFFFNNRTCISAIKLRSYIN
jgi:hypothetical protein